MNCKIIRDLLPLYHDDVASEESRALVEEHLETCAECAKMLEDIRESVSEKSAARAEQPIISGLKALKKRLRRKTVIAIAISFLCAAGIVSALIMGVFLHETPLPYSEVQDAITQPIDARLNFITDVGGYNAIYTLHRDGALYFCYASTFWTRHVSKPMHPPRIVLYGNILPEAPEIPELPELPEMPEMPGSPDDEDMLLMLPELPPAPSVHEIIGEVTRIYYLEDIQGAVALDDTAFARAVESAILLWEAP